MSFVNRPRFQPCSTICSLCEAETDDLNFRISFSLVLTLGVKWENAHEKHLALVQHNSQN